MLDIIKTVLEKRDVNLWFEFKYTKLKSRTIVKKITSVQFIQKTDYPNQLSKNR